jgi:hypothetical protein
MTRLSSHGRKRLAGWWEASFLRRIGARYGLSQRADGIYLVEISTPGEPATCYIRWETARDLGWTVETYRKESE